MNTNQRPFHLSWSKRPKTQQAQNIDKQFGIWRRLLKGKSNSPRFLCRSCEGITPAESPVCISSMYQLHLDSIDFSLFHIIFIGGGFAKAWKGPLDWQISSGFTLPPLHVPSKGGTYRDVVGVSLGLESCGFWLFPRTYVKLEWVLNTPEVSNEILYRKCFTFFILIFKNHFPRTIKLIFSNIYS